MGIGADLLTSLISYWKLDEASGSRADSYGSNTLTDNNTVTGAGGPDPLLIPLASNFVAANSEFLSVGDNASISIGGGVQYTQAVWVYLDSKPSMGHLFAKREGTGSLEYYLRFHGTNDRFQLQTSPDGNTPVTSVLDNVLGSPALATWYFVVCGFDGTNIWISTNDGAKTTTASSGIYDGTATLKFGRGNNSESEFHDGRLAGAGLWKRTLTAAEITFLYNGGHGCRFSSSDGFSQTPPGGGGSGVPPGLRGLSVFRSRGRR